MSVKPLIDRVEEEVKDVLATDFEYSGTSSVPNSDDSGLTFERGDTKRSKELETCVLYVDIRNSVALNEKHHTKTMGRLYTAFTKAVLRAADYHSGFVRNIIGDRVMVIFPLDNCFKNAVDCAVSINHISSYIIHQNFNGLNFKCGIGIDYGQLRVIKVGIERRGTERTDNKNLVWVGYPANIASRLTDMANKTFEEEYFEVKRNPINPRAVKVPQLGNLLMRIMDPDNYGYNPNAPLYLASTETVELSPEDFANSIIKYNHNNNLFHSGGNLIDFQKKTRKYACQPILVTEDVFKGLKKEDPNRNSLKNNWWHKETPKIKNISGEIYGADLIWKI